MDIYTFKFRDNGVVLNDDPSSSIDPFIDIQDIEGLSNAEYRLTERTAEGQDGGFVDAEFEDTRTIIISGTVYSTVDGIENILETLKENYSPSNNVYPLYIQPPNSSERVVFCKSLGVKYNWSTMRRTGTTDIQIQLKAEDPTIYDSLLAEAVCGVTPSAGGRSYPKSYNYGYGTVIEGGYEDDYLDSYAYSDAVVNSIAVVTSSGNKPAKALLTIFGPVQNPVIVHDTSGKRLTFSISLTEEQYLEIDLRKRTVLLNGTANRRHTLLNHTGWFLLPPGINSFRLLGTDPIAGLPNPQLVIQTRGAYR